MDKNIFNLNMEHFSSSGVFLSVEEQLLHQVSLPLLQSENHFLSVAFWGKVLGTDKSYYVAQGRGKDFIRNKMSFYSLDGNMWRLLLPPDYNSLTKFHLVRTRFIGDPFRYHRYVDIAWEEGDVDKKGAMQEETRLSCLVALMDADTAIAPRGGFCLSPNGIVMRNNYFHGLSKSAASKLGSYLHLRLPDVDTAFIRRFYVPDADRAIDFLEPISRDIPSGCWSMQIEKAGELIIVRNLWWPGMIFYHLPGTREFGQMYIGFGDKNDDLPFMV